MCSLALGIGMGVGAIMGAMLGGILEYNSMYFGFQFLYWLAMGLYLLAFVATYIGPGAVRPSVVR
jgi:hypothetical protein